MEQLKYVSPEYQARLDRLAELLVTSKRFGAVALEDTVEIPVIQDNIEVGEE